MSIGPRKTALALVLLSFVVCQVTAVVPIPIKECTKTVVVDPKYDARADFARDFNVTFEDFLQYNEKSRKNCMDLDTGEKMCVSINSGEKTAPAADADASLKEAKDEKKTIGAAGEAVKPEHTRDAKPAVKATEDRHQEYYRITTRLDAFWCLADPVLEQLKSFAIPMSHIKQYHKIIG
ncbi:hypothetical protein BGZ47_009927 [Haplosporangium gracile]|nr:hypothetical protein BGZ47_009927 [Haplosporangium gracile]